MLKQPLLLPVDYRRVWPMLIAYIRSRRPRCFLKIDIFSWALDFFLLTFVMLSLLIYLQIRSRETPIWDEI
jgi:hypothetical protein